MARQISLKGRCLTLAQPGFRMCVKAPRGLSEAGRDVVVAWTSNSPRRSTSSCHSLFADVLATVHASAHEPRRPPGWSAYSVVMIGPTGPTVVELLADRDE